MKGWRTLAYSAGVAVAGVLLAFDWSLVVPAPYMGAVIIAVAAGTAALRVITTTPVGKSQ